MQVLSWPEADVPLPLRRQVVALQDQAWPPADGCPSGPAPSHDPALRPVSMLLVEDGRVLAALDVLRKDVDHAGQRWAACGLSTVVTDAAVRRRGNGHRLVAAAREAMAASGDDLGIFTCDVPLAPFYVGAGWRLLPGSALVGGTPADPFPSDAVGKAVLADFFTPRARAAAAAFVGARIALYPGTIDRLW